MSRETEIAWAAGFFEGEGTIGIYSCGNRGYPTWGLSVKLFQVDKAPIDRFLNIVGIGRIYERKRDLPSRNIWTWETDSKGGALVLSLLFPYLSGVKREQALIAIEFREHMDKTGRIAMMGRPLPTKIVEIRSGLASRLKELKHQQYV